MTNHPSHLPLIRLWRCYTCSLEISHASALGGLRVLLPVLILYLFLTISVRSDLPCIASVNPSQIYSRCDIARNRVGTVTGRWKRNLQRQPVFAVVYGCGWAEASSGSAGWDHVVFCLASSLLYLLTLPAEYAEQGLGNGRVSTVRRSVCPVDRQEQRCAAGLLLSAGARIKYRSMAAGAEYQLLSISIRCRRQSCGCMGVASCWQPMDEAPHRLVCLFCECAFICFRCLPPRRREK